MHMLQIYWWNL